MNRPENAQQLLDAVSPDVARLNPQVFGKVTVTEEWTPSEHTVKVGGKTIRCEKNAYSRLPFQVVSTAAKERKPAPSVKKQALPKALGGSLSIPINPVAKARARTVTNNGKVHSFTPKKTKDYEDTLKQYFAAPGLQMIPKPTPIKLTVTFYIEQPKRSKLDYPTIRPDVDNYCKSLFDAANGLLWEDDSQIVDLHARKVYIGREGYIDLTVEAIWKVSSVKSNRRSFVNKMTA